jgi:ribosomal protein L24
MKIINFVEIEGYQLITSIGNASPDPEETNNKVDVIIAENPDILLKKTKDELLVENVVFARLGQGQKYVDDDEGEKLESIFDSLGSQWQLQLSGDTITDLRNKEYYIKKAGLWEKQKINSLGQTLPKNAVLSDELTTTQQREIAEQEEEERQKIIEKEEEVRIANLTPEQKDEEKKEALTIAKREVRILKEEAEIADEPFDATKEYQIRKAKIEEKYRLNTADIP